MQPKSIALLQKIDNIIETIILKFSNIFENLQNANKTTETLAMESVTMENNCIQIIRLCQDLISISRNLKEVWVLNSIKVTQEKPEWKQAEIDSLFTSFNLLTDKIAQFEMTADGKANGERFTSSILGS
ncbi:Mediator of RNA polymerase II transcription subunit 22 [Candida viswanathii]|uniref:Mediator of RNA polymerase II transcription subunit 22 n=1 Tax=Candida viswanathii TaxID=5486 RepID=A0A367XR60_9ASCO|nr:Mediator of RNA polymerase II transcription subunit 22 [Candida viswanathii]